MTYPHVTASKDLVANHYCDIQQLAPLTIWLTGLSGAGKSTLAEGVQRWLLEAGIKALRIDGDHLRAGLCDDLHFSPEDRSENVRRAAHVAKLLNDQATLVIVSMISPTVNDRQCARNIIGDTRFREVYVHADLEVCHRRDPKGLYARVACGEIGQFTGISAPYEPPTLPDLIISTTSASASECILNLARFVQRHARREAVTSARDDHAGTAAPSA